MPQTNKAKEVRNEKNTTRNIAVLSLAVFSNIGLAQNAKPTVLVIESYHKEFYWDAAYRKGIENIIGDRVHLHYFEMDTKRLLRPNIKSVPTLRLPKSTD